jgi:hypothetical protein
MYHLLQRTKSLRPVHRFLYVPYDSHSTERGEA